MDCSLPGSSVHWVFQARILEWVGISFSRRSSWLRDWTRVPLTVGRRFTIWATREVQGWLGLWWGGTSIPWSTHFTKVFLLVFRIWSHHEGIQCFSRYEEMQGLRSQNLFLKTSNYLKTRSHQIPWSAECLTAPWTPSGCVAGQQPQGDGVQSP